MKKTKTFTQEELATFCAELSLLLKSGITPIDALHYMQADSVSTEGAQILKNIQQSLLCGLSLQEAMSETGLFPNYCLEMIKLGEETGNLDVIVKKLAEYYEQQVAIKKTVKNALTYPILMLTLMLLILIVLLTKVLPIFNQVFSQMGAELSGMAKRMLSIGNTLQSFSMFFIILAVFLFFIALFFAKNRKGHAAFLHFLHTSRFTRNLYLDIAYSRFAASLSLVNASGVNLYLGLDMIDRLIQNELMSAKINCCKKALAQNAFLYDALKEAEIFKSSQLRILQIAYKTGSADEELMRISAYYEDTVTQKLQNLLSLIEPTLVILFSVIVGSMLLSVILPLVGIMSNIG